MGMLRTGIDMQVAENLVTQACLGQHTLNCHPHKLCRPLCEDLLGGGETLSARISGVMRVHPVGHLVSLEGHLLGVDHDDIVTTVHVGSEAGLVLAAEDKGNTGSETSQREVGRIDANPLLVYSRLVERNCLVTECVHKYYNKNLAPTKNRGRKDKNLSAKFKKFLRSDEIGLHKSIDGGGCEKAENQGRDYDADDLEALEPGLSVPANGLEHAPDAV